MMMRTVAQLFVAALASAYSAQDAYDQESLRGDRMLSVATATAKASKASTSSTKASKIADAKAEKTSSAEAAKAKSCHPKNLLHRTFEKFDGMEANLKKLVDEGGLGEAGVTDQDALTATAKWLSSTQWQWNATFTAAEFMEYEEHQFAVMTLRFDRYNNLRGSGFWDMLALCAGSTEDDGEWKITCADTTDNDIKIFRCLDETTMVMESLESLVPMETASSDQSRRKLPGKTTSPKGMALLLQDYGNERFIPQPELN